MASNSLLARAFLWAIRGYQQRISPYFPGQCRYYPTCSEYMRQAVVRHGALKGGLMGTARLLRCQPLARGGIDLVPEHFSLKKNPDPTPRNATELAAIQRFFRP